MTPVIEQPGRLDTGDQGRSMHPVALFVLAATLATGIGGAIGTAIGVTISRSVNADCTAYDDWCELDGLVSGFLIGAAVGIAVYLVVGIVTIRRYRPSGRRAAHIIIHSTLPLAAPTALATLLSTLPA
ncbi:MAG: hypothetical protein RIB65_03260 [Ilumatobacter fluminis]|uniref:hypothetical protein n=1 Tax=Ilumatobacter fluminis TaxID=467091 RepID=UPI0032EF598B